MVVEDNDIIQVDATVIVGVLIFLTLSNLFGPNKSEGITKITLTLLAIIPFAGSAIAIGLGNSFASAFKELGLYLMVGGFIYLIVIFVVLGKFQTSVKNECPHTHFSTSNYKPQELKTQMTPRVRSDIRDYSKTDDYYISYKRHNNHQEEED